jgi:hypothetical protein
MSLSRIRSASWRCWKSDLVESSKKIRCGRLKTSVVSPRFQPSSTRSHFTLPRSRAISSSAIVKCPFGAKSEIA